jgi:elongation factor G
MKVYDAAGIRNVALVGHSGSGKTQLASALLFDAGAVNRFGKVDDGTTVTDYDEEEIARKHTLAAALAPFEWNKCKINLIDTPGMGNFLSDARAALRVAEAALVIVDAISGVQVSTEKVWSNAEEFQLHASSSSTASTASAPASIAPSSPSATRSAAPAFPYSCRLARRSSSPASSIW